MKSSVSHSLILESTSVWPSPEATVSSITLEGERSTWRKLSAIHCCLLSRLQRVWKTACKLTWYNRSDWIDVSWEIVREAGNLKWYQCFWMWLNSLCGHCQQLMDRWIDWSTLLIPSWETTQQFVFIFLNSLYEEKKSSPGFDTVTSFLDV